MPSVRARLVTWLLRAINRRRIYETADGLSAAAAATKRSDEVVSDLDRWVRVEGDPTREREVVVLRPPDPRDAAILYIHGGGWVFPARKEHWRFLARLALDTGCDIHVALYPLAPQHHHLGIMSYLLPIYDALIESGRPIVLMGDSAGGNIALNLLKVAEAGGQLKPAAVALIAPVTDITLGNPDSLAMAPKDPMLAVEGLRAAGRWYAGALDALDGRVSPLRSALGHLPKTLLMVGTKDLLLPDCRLFRDAVRSAGVPLEYHEGEGMMHVWPVVPLIPEATVARRTIADFVVRAIDRGNSSLDKRRSLTE